jgi:UMF1 family MFS transporter
MARLASQAANWRDAPVLRWSLFDAASSTWIALVPSFFGLYFVNVIGAGQPQAGALWGATAAGSLVLVALLAPVVGAWADHGRRWVAVIALCTGLCVTATLLLPLGAAAGLLSAALLFVLAQAGYTLAISQYDALIVRVAAPGQVSRTSALAWAIGLVGGVAGLGGALWLQQGVPSAAQAAQLPPQFLLAALLFGLLSLPGLVALHRLLASTAPVVARTPDATAGARPVDALRAVVRTCREWRRHRTAFTLLLGFFLVNDVLVTLQFFSGILLRDRFSLDVQKLLWLSLLFHLVALPSTVLAGQLADRIGAGRTLAGMCAVLAAALLLLAYGTAAWTPAAAAVLLGLVFASLQAVFRALYATHVPAVQMAELFGFNAIAGRLSAALGPLLFGVAAALLGTSTALVLMLAATGGRRDGAAVGVEALRLRSPWV